jgi:outer membrane lipoprotein carrier protein
MVAGIFDFKTIKSDFIQKVTDENNATIVYKGKFYASSNSQALWIYKTPIKKSIYFDKDRVVIIEPELEQAIMATLKNSPSFTEIIQRAKKVSKDLYKTNFENTNYYVKTKKGRIVEISYEDKLGNSIEVKLLNSIKDVALDSKIFDIKIPKGYDIVSE